MMNVFGSTNCRLLLHNTNTHADNDVKPIHLLYLNEQSISRSFALVQCLFWLISIDECIMFISDVRLLS